MIKIWYWIKNNPNRAMFLVPIILVALISISHVVTWYDMANPINWAIYLSVAIEIAAMTALVAASTRVKGGVWFMFGIVTFIQIIGNVFYCYKEIDDTGELFKSWIELTGPIWELMGTETTDVIGMKRWLAFLEGGLLPIISLTSLHFFVKYDKREEEYDNEKYFASRNKHMEKVVEENKKKAPEDTPIKEETIETDTKDESEDDFELVLSVPEGKEFNTPYPIPKIVDAQAELEKQLDESISEMIGDHVPKVSNSDEEIVAAEEQNSEENNTPIASTPPVEEERKAKSVKATTPPASGKKDISDKNRID